MSFRSRGRNVCLIAVLICSIYTTNPVAQTLGPEFRVNTVTTDNQDGPHVAFDATGASVVVWESLGEDGAGWGVYGQRFDALGSPVGEAFLVNTTAENSQMRPAVAMNASGQFVVVWEGYQVVDGYPEYEPNIFAQRFNSSGEPLGSEILVNPPEALGNYNPDVGIDDSGAFLVVWLRGFSGVVEFIYGQTYGADGNPVGGRTIMAGTNGSLGPGVIAMNGSGDFVMVYSISALHESIEIHANRGNIASIGSSSELVNTTTEQTQTNPDVSINSSGDHVVVWESYYQDGSGIGIYAQRFDGGGNPVGEETLVNEYTDGHQLGPTVALDEYGDFVTSWQCDKGDRDSTDVYARKYLSLPGSFLPEFRVNQFLTGDQYEPALGAHRYGNHILAWTSNGQDGSGTGVFARRFDSAPVAVAIHSIVARAVGECVEVTWDVWTDEPIAGFRVYRRNGADGEIDATGGTLLGPGTNQFVDTDIDPGRAYVYSVGAVRPDGSEVRSMSAMVTVPPGRGLALEQNRPNPFNPSTTIRYELTSETRVTLTVYDVDGRLVATLVDGMRGAGPHETVWNGRDDAGSPVGSGVYFYRLRAGTKELTRKMVVVK